MAHDTGCGHNMRTGMVEPLLREIAQHLDALARTGQASAIDLRSLPMTDADRSELEARLGRGEVQAELSVAGDTRVWETGYPGVWWVRHLGAGERVAAEEIAIAHVPVILMTHGADVAASALRLKEALAVQDPTAAKEESHA